MRLNASFLSQTIRALPSAHTHTHTHTHTEPPGGGRASAVSSESEASVTAEGDAGPGLIDNSVLCVPDPSGNKKLPSLTNEGTAASSQSSLRPLGALPWPLLHSPPLPLPLKVGG